MKKVTFGTPEKLTPSYFCKNFNYVETETSYDVSSIRHEKNSRGYKLILPLGNDEQIFGFGLQLKRMNWTGGKATLRVNADPVAATGDSHAPVPFFVSTAGYGIYFDTARYAEFNIGSAMTGTAVENGSQTATSFAELYSYRKPEKGVIAVQIPAADGIDIYIIEGKTITDIVAQYNMLSGGGCNVPDWGLGVFYRCHSYYNQDRVLAMADYFRASDIPCSVIGLEPGWHTHAYSCTYKWNETLFPDHKSMIRTLGEKGFHLNLWEHAFTHPDSPIYDEMGKGCCDFDVWGGRVPDFALPEIRFAFAKYHRENIVDGFLDGFKLDECDGSDLTGGWTFPNLSSFPSGLDGEQYHSLFGTLYMQTMLEALDGKPTLSQVRQAGALCASYPFVLYSDLYDHKDFIRGCVTAGFGGLLWSPEVRHAVSAEDMIRRLQTTVFSPHCLINAFYCEEAPWLPLGCEKEARETLKLREKLLPDLRRAFDEYRDKGIPPVRALVSDYTDDKETYSIDDEYIFCGNMIVCPMVAGEKSRSVYLPEGNWRDFHTGKAVSSGRFTVETDNIPVYVKA